MRKRWLALALAGAMAFGVCGCVQKEAEVLPPPSVEPAIAVEPTVAPTTALAAEPSVEADLFLSFLNGEIQATVGDDFYNDLAYIGSNIPEPEEISIRSLAELVEGTFAYLDFTVDTQMDYALLETRGGREMLVVRSFSSLGVEAYTGYFVFGAYDGQLILTYAEDGWSRSNTELYEGLIFSGEGSNGAGDNFIWRGYIDEDGHYKRVYEAEILSSAWVAMNAWEVFGMGNTDWAYGCECYLLTTEEGKFYDLDVDEDLTYIDPEKLALLRKYYEEQGMTEIDDAKKAMSEAEDAHGIQDTPIITNWATLELAK